MKKIPFGKPFIIGNELQYIQQAVESGGLSGNGLFTKKCHQWFEKNLKTHKALLTHSCTAALEMVATLCDFQADDEVIMPSYTFVSTANAFVMMGATPVFIDIDHTLNIDLDIVEQAITPKTKAIIAVHYAGSSCDMRRLMKIAKKHNLIVIEDAAQALLSKYDDQYLGSIGDFGCISFHETKNIISGEGGVLLINNPKYAERAEIIWEKGTNRSQFFRGEIDKYTWVDRGSSYLPSELISAFLYAQLEHATRINSKRQLIFQQYYDLLSNLEKLEYIVLPSNNIVEQINGHIFYFFTNSHQEQSDLLNYLKQHQINAVFHYVPLHSSPAGQKYCKTFGSLTRTDNLSQRIIRLPMFYELSLEDVYYICQKIKNFYLN